MAAAAGSLDKKARLRRAFWLRHLHQWHWISAAICLGGMLAFAITGFTLNHAGAIESKARVERKDGTLPQPMRESLALGAARAKSVARDAPVGAALPDDVADWLSKQLQVELHGRPAEWSASDVSVSLTRPGGDAWVSIEFDSGELQYERSDRGVIAFMNDLHKGRNTGAAWSAFIDLFAIACLVFCITGLFLLQLHSGRRAATWPMVGLGIAVPAVLALLFLH